MSQQPNNVTPISLKMSEEFQVAFKNIFDIIVTTHGAVQQVWLIVHYRPAFKFVQSEDHQHLTAEALGFKEHYYYQPVKQDADPKWKAFGGREFSLPMADGTFMNCWGQWWWGNPGEEYAQVGVATLPELEKCYVFTGAYIHKKVLGAILAVAEPRTDYHHYAKKQGVIHDPVKS